MEDPRAATFPRVVIVIMGVLSVALLLQSAIVRQKKNRPTLQNASVKNKGEKDDAAANNQSLSILQLWSGLDFIFPLFYSSLRPPLY
jgi:hypothetical protein